MQKKIIRVGNFRSNSHISIGILTFLQCQQSINPDFSYTLNCGNYENYPYCKQELVLQPVPSQILCMCAY